MRSLPSLITSHSLRWRLMIVFSQSIGSVISVLISMTGRFKKRRPSAHLSVCPYVTLINLANSSFIIMSHSFLWRHIVLLTVCVYSSNHRVLYTHWNRYDEEISKKCRSVRLSVSNANKKAYSSIIDSRKIIRISGERVWHPLQESEAIFKKKNVRPNF